MSKTTGGPAFPGIDVAVTGISSDGEERTETQAHGGMTLRDYFAAKAMAAYIAANSECPDDKLARLAYQTADAMLAERAA